VLVGDTVFVGSTANFSQVVCSCTATRLVRWSQENIRAVIRFLHVRHVSAAEIHRQLVDVYGEEAIVIKVWRIGVHTSNPVEFDNGW